MLVIEIFPVSYSMSAKVTFELQCKAALAEETKVFGLVKSFFDLFRPATLHAKCNQLNNLICNCVF